MRKVNLIPAVGPVGGVQDSDHAIRCVREVNIAHTIDSYGNRTGEGCIGCRTAITRIARCAIPRDCHYDSIWRDFADSVVAAICDEEVACVVHRYTYCCHLGVRGRSAITGKAERAVPCHREDAPVR